MMLLQIDDLAVWFETDKGDAKAVDGITFSIDKGETVGLVGESGCGKTVTGLAILRLVPRPPGRIIRGRILFDNEDILAMNPARLRRFRGGRIGMIFQDPAVSLNPVFTIGSQLCEALALHKGLKGDAARDRAKALLDEVKIPKAGCRLNDYPHQLSGGMQQRIVIALALAGEPELLIADEPTTALDVTIQAEILELMDELQRAHGMAILLITHDLGVVARRTRRTYVMYAGKIVEEGPTKQIIEEPLHPYTQALLSAVPSRHLRGKKLARIPGSVPQATNYPSGCRFHPRCPDVREECSMHEPPLYSPEEKRNVACVLHHGREQ